MTELPLGTAVLPKPSEVWRNPGVLGVGGASLLSDAGHEMATSLLPTFLASTLHAGPGVLGRLIL